MTIASGIEIPVDIFSEPIVWESPLQRVMEDLVRKGDDVFDVGANIGALSASLWKLVGQKGRVHSFEANPQLMERIDGNFSHHNLPVSYLRNAAVWSESGCTLTLQIDPSYYQSNSRIVSPAQNAANKGGHYIHVMSLSLDDYCEETGVAPSLIKIDVEGAEEQVLRGASRILDSCRPSVVLEYICSDPAPALFLKERGYSLFDVHSYKSLDPSKEERASLLTDILAVHRSNAVVQDSQWKYDPKIIGVRTIQYQKPLQRGHSVSTGFFNLQPGRWMISAEFDLAGTGNACLRVTDEQNRDHYMCEAPHPMCDAPYPYISSYVCRNAVLKLSQSGRFQCSLESRSPDLLIMGGSVQLSEIIFGNA